MGVNNSNTMSGMRLIFFFFLWKSSKFNAESENEIKIPKNIFSFGYNCILTGSGKLSSLVREYL